MTQSAPSYQPYQQPPPVHQQAPPPQRRAPGGLNGLLAAIAALVAAALTVGGLFGSLHTYRSEQTFEGDTFVIGWLDNWWGFSDEGSTDPIDSENSLAGLILVLAAALLVAGAVFLLMARTRRNATPTAGRALTVAGVGVLTGAVLLELFSGLAELSRHNERELSAGETVEFSLGIGLFLPLGAAVVGIAAAVLAHLRQTPGRVEPVTPQMGFRQPYGTGPQPMPGYAQPHAPVPADERPTTVDTPGTESPAGAGQEAEVTQQVTVHENPSAPPAPTGPVQAAPAGYAQSGYAQQPGAHQPGVALPGATAGTPQPYAQPAPGAFAAPPQPPAPVQPASPVEQALTAQPTPPAPAPLAAPAAPAQAEAPAAPADPATPAQAEAPAGPSQAEAPAAPADAPAAPSAESTEDLPAGPAISGLSGLPAAPPAPELSGEDETKK